MFNLLQEKEICGLYSDGKTMGELGKKFNCSISTIKRELIKNSITRRTNSETHRCFNDKQEKKICKLYINGDSSSKIAGKVKCSDTTIRDILKRNKIPRKNSGSEIHKLLNLPEDIKSFLIGDILSDGHITKPKGNGNSYLEWTLKYESYAKYLVKIYTPYFKIQYRKNKPHYDKRTKQWYFGWTVWTEYNPTFTEWRKKWYQTNPDYPEKSKDRYLKIVPKDLILTPRICLNWNLGDGTLDKKSYRLKLCTNNFIQRDVDFLIEKLKEIGINPTRGKDGDNFTINFSRIETGRFLNYIGPCPIKCYSHRWNWKPAKQKWNGFGCCKIKY
jgi:Mor family transcriptional regulator